MHGTMGGSLTIIVTEPQQHNCNIKQQVNTPLNPVLGIMGNKGNNMNAAQVENMGPSAFSCSGQDWEMK